MFKFLKEKLKGAISKLSRKVEEEAKAEEPIKEEALEEKKEEIKEGFPETGKEQKEESAVVEEEEAKKKPLMTREEQKEKTKEESPVIREREKWETKKEISQPKEKAIEEEPKPEEKAKEKGFFGRLKEKISTTTLSYEKFENLFSDLEIILLENNVAFEVIEKIKSDLGKNLVEKPIKRNKIEESVKESLKNSVNELFNVEEISLLEKIRQKKEKPFVISFLGINGSGKTTTIAKIADMLRKNKVSCILAASDTFRAASIEQLQIHADKLGIKIIKHDYGSDPAAVAFDAIKHAKAKNIDAVLIDTAGRMHSNINLIEEMKKIIRVAKPDLKIFVGESITGNDCIEQAKTFNEAVGIDGIILAKADVDEKGGAAISVSYVTNKPIIYLGTGQEYKDLKEFEPGLIVEGLGL
ncbi:signal recognition particle-docking protein FtsY [Candidatus Woesearchaeota archaeon]|nr:signal recognition particle-docking protein FtsY [Candidatus Woesearchaeota archaeon]